MIKKIYKWIWDKLGWFVIGGVALAGTVDVLNTSQTETLVSLENTVKTDLQDNGKYKRRNKEIINDISYTVHEYETSKGEKGYTVFITKEEDNKVYKKAISTGVQKEDREFDWRLIQDNNEVDLGTATTTK